MSEEVSAEDGLGDVGHVEGPLKSSTEVEFYLDGELGVDGDGGSICGVECRQWW